MGKTAIDAQRFDAFWIDPQAVVLVDNPAHPLYDERVNLALDPLKVDEVAEDGIHTPISIRKEIVGDVPPVLGGKPKRGEEALVVVDGRQRVRWARAANAKIKKAGGELLRVPAIVKRGADAQLLGICMTTNSVREEETPITKARKVEQYMRLGRSEEEAARKMGVGVAAVRGWLKLLELAPAVQVAVERGEVAAGAVAGLAGLPREDQEAALEVATEGGKKPTARKVREASGKTIRPSAKVAKMWIAKLLALSTPKSKAAAMFGAYILGRTDVDGLLLAAGEFEPVWKEVARLAAPHKPHKEGEGKRKGKRSWGSTA